MRRVILLAVAALRSATAQETPQINVDGIVPNQAGTQRPLRPGMKVSIYGRHLGPDAGCTAGIGALREVKELCGTAVTVGGVPATLLYVQETQKAFCPLPRPAL